MASEQRGILYEAITYYALSKLGARLGRGKKAYWNETPQLMSIDTDITVGPSAEAPTHLFLVSHCTAEHNSDMKFWRNIGEVGEANVVFRDPPSTTCILFDAKFKRNLLMLQPYAFDDHIDVSTYLWGQRLIEFAHSLHGALPCDREAKLKIIEDTCLNDSELRKALVSFSKRLAIALKAKSPKARMLWSAARAVTRPAIEHTVARSTSLRRGLAKMLFFEKLPSFGQRAEELSRSLNMTSPSIRGTLLTDPDVSSALREFDRDLLERLHEVYRAKRELMILVEPLRAIDSCFAAFWDYLVENWTDLTSPKGLYSHLVKTHDDRDKTVKQAKIKGYLPPGWLLVMSLTLLKAATKKRMEFGYSKVVNAIHELSGDERNRAAKSLFTPTEIKKARGSRTIEYGMRDWIYADVRQNFTLLPQELFLVAVIVANKLRSSIGETLSPDLEGPLKQFFVEDTIETKLVAHPAFRPLKDLIAIALQTNRIQFVDVPYHPSPLSLLARLDGKQPNIRAASTNVIMARSTLIRWISASDEGKMHKCKEFCGRGWGLKLRLNGHKQLEQSPDITQTVLVIDGTFNQGEVDALRRAGWDKVLYPDEMPRLVSALG